MTAGREPHSTSVQIARTLARSTSTAGPALAEPGSAGPAEAVGEPVALTQVNPLEPPGIPPVISATQPIKEISAMASSKRELIDTGTDKRYVRRDSNGRFKESDDVGRSLAADQKRQAKNSTKSGQGDRGDRKSG